MFVQIIWEIKVTGMEVYLEDLLKLKKKIWVRLENEFRKELINKTIKKVGSLYQLSKLLKKELGIKSNSTIYHWYKGKRGNRDCTKIISHGIPLHVLKFLSDYVQIPMSEIEKYIDFIKGDGPANKIFNPKFPIPLNEATASVISHTLHDGYLEPKKLRVVYSNKEKENLEHFKESVIKMFNASEVEFGEILDSDGVTRIGAPNIVGCVLVCFGLRPGNKVKNDVEVPKILLECKNEKIIGAFLGSLIADESSVIIQPIQVGGYVKIQLNGLHKDRSSRLLIHDSILFNNLGILTTKLNLDGEKLTKNGENRYRWYFNIGCQRNLINLQRKVKIPLNRKQDLLDQAISSYKKLQDAILIKDNLRLSLFECSVKKFNNSQINLSKFLSSILNRNISEASIRDWRKGRYHCPVDVLVCLAMISRVDLEYLLKNVVTYKTTKNDEPIKPDKDLKGMLQEILNELAFNI